MSKLGITIRKSIYPTHIYYAIESGEGGKGKLFLSGKEISEALKNSGFYVKNEAIGHVEFQLDNPHNPKNITQTSFYPIGRLRDQHFNFFVRKGIASSIEYAIYNDLIKKYPTIKNIIHNAPFDSYRKVLRKRGLPYKAMVLTHGFQRTINALRRYRTSMHLKGRKLHKKILIKK
ncbi:MAG: hypothetical protein HYW05_05500 [Candidatus Diapherotrites archaeon]|nr:hypothetical protein [Candidatus Diapherotrites archaeon]